MHSSRSHLFLTDMKRAGFIIAGFAAVLLYLRFHGFLVFHVAAEGITIIISAFIIIRVATAAHLRRNAFFAFMAGSFIAVATFDTLHTVTYQGMGILPVHGANTATTFWVLARAMEAGAYFISLLLLGRSVLFRVPAFGFTIVSALGVAAVFCGWLPGMYVDGAGLTLTKVWSEYVLIGAMLACLMLVFRMHEFFSARVQVSFILAIGLTVLSEFIFTMYANTVDNVNTLGHILKFFSFCFILLTVHLHSPPTQETA